MGIKYEIPADNLIYLSGFEVNSSQLIVIKFYDDGKFQEFCPYPEEGLTELNDLREAKMLLEAAVYDFSNMYDHIFDCDGMCDTCPIHGNRDTCDKWVRADEVLKLIGEGEDV